MEQKYIDRFWTKVSKVPDANGCLNWTASHMKTGYGAFGEYKKVHNAHRLAWVLTYGAVPDGLHVCHRCDNRSCCNVNHLFIGTPMDNVKDKIAKGRQLRGSGIGNSKLTELDVWVIKSLKFWSGFSHSEIASEYGVAPNRVSLIARGKQWGHTRWP